MTRFSSNFGTKAAMVVGMAGLLSLGACDQSKAELDATKQTLATVTADRDALKGQVETLKAQAESAKKEADDAKKALADMQAKAAAPAAETPPAAQEPAKGGAKPAHKATGTAKAPPPPAAADPTKPPVEKAPEQVYQGGSHFKRN